MKRPLAYVTAAWYGGDSENAEQAARYWRGIACVSCYRELLGKPGGR